MDKKAVIQTAVLDKSDDVFKVNGNPLMKWTEFLESPLNELQDYLQETADALQPGKLPFNRKIIQHELNGVLTTLQYNNVYNQQTGRDFSSISTARGAADLSGSFNSEGGSKSRRKSKRRKSRRRKTRR